MSKESRQDRMIRSLRELSGFTLIEMLIVVSLMTLVGIGTFKSILNGLKLWEYSQQSSVEEDIAIFLDKVSLDLKNSFSFSTLTNEWREDHLAFATMVRGPRNAIRGTAQDEVIDQIGKVEYYYDSNQSTIFKRQSDYGQAVDEKYSGSLAVAENIKSLEFQYYKQAGDELELVQHFKESLPHAVRVIVEFDEYAGKRRQYNRLINLPL